MDSPPKKRSGRPPKAEDEVLIQRSYRAKEGQWARFDGAGGIAWLRALLDAGDVRWLRALIKRAKGDKGEPRD